MPIFSAYFGLSSTEIHTKEVQNDDDVKNDDDDDEINFTAQHKYKYNNKVTS